MVLANKQIYWLGELKWGPRKRTHKHDWLYVPEIHIGRKTTSSTNGAGQFGSMHVEESK